MHALQSLMLAVLSPPFDQLEGKLANVEPLPLFRCVDLAFSPDTAASKHLLLC
jgi:hypothetical protein